MKSTLKYVLCEGQFTAFHIFSIAFFILGFFVAMSGTEMGPFAPLLVSSGIYLVLLSLLLEGIYWLRILVRKVLAGWMAA